MLGLDEAAAEHLLDLLQPVVEGRAGDMQCRAAAALLPQLSRYPLCQ